jgi:ATP-dependent RNA helicase DDX42
VADDEDGDVEYDADGNPIAPVRSKFIDPLPPIDHSLIAYKPFEKNFYVEHTDIAGLSPIQVRKKIINCLTGVCFLPNSIV